MSNEVDAADDESDEGDGESPSAGSAASDGEEADARESDGEEKDDGDEKNHGDEENDGDEKDDGEPLLPRGNPLRIARGAFITIAGLLAGLAFLILPTTPRGGVPSVGLASLVVVFGLLDLVGSFGDPDERVASSTGVEELLAPGGLLLTGLAITWATLRCAVAGIEVHLGGVVLTPVHYAAVLAPLGFVGALVGAGLSLTKLGVLGDDRPLHRRHGLWLLAIATILYLPMLGSYSLVDPWETHYGEVAREILARQDWVSLWWAQEDWFWSKPILGFWIQAIGMVVFGVRYEPGQMMSGVAEGHLPFPEWAVRMPIFLMTLGATYLLYKAVARVFGRRAGLLGGLVLTTMPQWFFLAHQTMTDMPFVATMAGAIALVLLAQREDENRLVRVYEIGFGPFSLRVSAYHLVVGAILLTAVPQILYLLSKNVALNLDPRWGLRSPPVVLVKDSFMSGSPGNCGLPGNSGCDQVFPSLTSFQPAVQAFLWTQALALLLYMNWGERRAQRLYYLGAWYLAALSTMAKGPAGIVIPVACVLLHLVVTGRWKSLLEMEITSGLCVVAAVALPWFVAMYARHGEPFLDRLLFHDMYKRAFEHVHDTNQGEDVSFRYFLWQLGYATFPWIGVVPLGVASWLRRREEASGEPLDEGERAKQSTSAFLLLWVLLGFAMFSLIQTKFHHYIFPIVPALAMLVGIALDELFTRHARATSSFRDRYERAAFGIATALGAMLVILVGRDMAHRRVDQPADARFIHLFTYNYEREWPASLDYTKHFWIASFVCAGALALVSILPIRRLATILFTALACAFTAWTLDVYFVETAAHWGQRETVVAYYRESQRVPGPIISYEQNWKGENFYMGNHIAAFPSSGQPFKNYIAELRRKKVKTFYFFVIPGRVGSLKSELGYVVELATLTELSLNNKFVLVRATLD